MPHNDRPTDESRTVRSGRQRDCRSTEGEEDFLSYSPCAVHDHMARLLVNCKLIDLSS